MKATHTLGPWQFESDYLTITGSKGRITICEVHDHSDTGDRTHDLAEAQANARLIAAAPELLSALELLQKAIHDARLLDVRKRFDLCVADAAAGTAIHRARGGQ